MFFTPRFNLTLDQAPLCFSAETKIDAPSPALTRRADRLLRTPQAGECVCPRLRLLTDLPDALRTALEAHMPLPENPETCLISVSALETVIWARDERGLGYGLATLLDLDNHGELCGRLICDYPVCALRGYRVYLPGQKNFAAFRDMVDLLADYKYNAIILEIGGAMEYHRHPEINARWLEFCADVHRYSGRAKEIQFHTYPWEKDSIHCDNGDGGVLTQDECRALAEYCRERGLEVIPECPTLSHSDYLVQPHPELRERQNDEHADTYCPSNPETYRLVFDVLDEVISVFHPARINIGHDELYSVGVCDRCRGKNPAELYAGDVAKIKRYLDARGIGVLMWGEKLLPAIDEKGRPIGGSHAVKTRNGGTYEIPALYPAADLMPAGITYLHWYWSFDENYDRVYHDRKMPMVFGNLRATTFKNWRKRLGWGAGGGFVSNWGSNDPEYLQRNLQTGELIYTAYAFWCPDYDDDAESRARFCARMMEEAFHRQHKGVQDAICILHTTDYAIPFKYFYDGIFIEDEIYLLGHYLVRYCDGGEARLPVKYGTNISTSHHDNYVTNPAYHEICGTTLPRFDGERFHYLCAYPNPRPGTEIASITYCPLPGKEEAVVEFSWLKED